jgi:preprotein translocase subunit SecG
MGVLSTVLLVFFALIALLLILLVLVQNEEGDSLGGIFAGGSASAFGSRSGNVLTRATTVLGALFLIISLSLALLNRTRGGAVESAAAELSGEATETHWLEDELNRVNAETAAPEAVDAESGENAAGNDESAASE